jgi:AraC family transcriptional regulator, regulatory protein of adaptative response / DNA-3-methyladenine glycosylase II
MVPGLERAVCYRRVCERDPRYDGTFFTAARSTGRYCRTICTARTPALKDCLFYPSMAAAHAAGFRACHRCRPEAAPGFNPAPHRDPMVSSGLRRIQAAPMGETTDVGLAAELGVESRVLRLAFERELGVTPAEFAHTRRTHFAKQLLDQTCLPKTVVARATGFSGAQPLRTALLRHFGQVPATPRRFARTSEIVLRLAYRPPFDWAAITRYLRPRLAPGIEMLGRAGYRRSVAFAGRHGLVMVRPVRGRNELEATIDFPLPGDYARIVWRLRQLFDLDADPTAIAGHLLAQKRFKDGSAALRVPGAWDPFELAVRAILGQQISVAAATTIMGRLVRRYGVPLVSARATTDGIECVFPHPVVLAAADLSDFGLPRRRAATVVGLARMCVAEPDFLESFHDRRHAVTELCKLSGIGEWTAEYIALRALHEPDAFPASDLGIRRALARGPALPSVADVRRAAEPWRPWRAYAAMHLWSR